MTKEMQVRYVQDIVDIIDNDNIHTIEVHGKTYTQVVRCKDCKWIDFCKDPEFYEYKGANGFCSKGERKDEVEE